MLKGNCEQKVDRNLVCRLDSAMTLSRPDPSAPKAIDELSKMVETRKTPDYKGGKKGGNGKPISPRDLGDLKAKLEELLLIYEEKLKAWWEAKDAGQVGSSCPTKQRPTMMLTWTSTLKLKCRWPSM